MVEDLCCSPILESAQDFRQQKRSLRIHGRSTTMRLERMFWGMLDDVARQAGLPLPRVVEILHDHLPRSGASNLASCCRVVCLKLCQGAIRVDDLVGAFAEMADSAHGAGADQNP